MNIKDFLMDNYIYIIIVIILIIITIIGFLADKKKNGGKKNSAMEQPMPNINMNNGVQPQPITYQPPINNNQINNVNTVPNNNLMSNTNQFNSLSNNNSVAANNAGSTVQNIPQPVEPMNASTYTNPEPMYQPLSEQKPIIPPANPINNINTNLNNQMGPEQPQVQQPSNNVIPNNINQNHNMYSQPINEQPIVQSPMANPMNNGQILNVTNYNNEMQNNPIPINPQPIPNPVENTIPSPVAPSQPVMPQTVGFVYGQPVQNQNNNQQM